MCQISYSVKTKSKLSSVFKSTNILKFVLTLIDILSRTLFSLSLCWLITFFLWCCSVQWQSRPMGRAPCCDKSSVKRGPWSPEEDATLKSYLEKHGTGGNWIALPPKAGPFIHHFLLYEYDLYFYYYS